MPPGRGLRRGEHFWLRLTIQPARSVCVSLSAFQWLFILNYNCHASPTHSAIVVDQLSYAFWRNKRRCVENWFFQAASVSAVVLLWWPWNNNLETETKTQKVTQDRHHNLTLSRHSTSSLSGKSSVSSRSSHENYTETTWKTTLATVVEFIGWDETFLNLVSGVGYYRWKSPFSVKRFLF